MKPEHESLPAVLQSEHAGRHSRAGAAGLMVQSKSSAPTNSWTEQRLDPGGGSLLRGQRHRAAGSTTCTQRGRVLWLHCRSNLLLLRVIKYEQEHLLKVLNVWNLQMCTITCFYNVTHDVRRWEVTKYKYFFRPGSLQRERLDCDVNHQLSLWCVQEQLPLRLRVLSL